MPKTTGKVTSVESAFTPKRAMPPNTVAMALMVVMAGTKTPKKLRKKMARNKSITPTLHSTLMPYSGIS